MLVNVDAVVVTVVAIIEDEEVGGEGCKDRLGLDGERRERDRDWLVVNGSLVDGSGAGCGAMRANEEGWIRRRADGFYSIELAKQQTAVLIASQGYKATSGVACCRFLNTFPEDLLSLSPSDFLSRLSLLCSSRLLHGPRQMMQTENGRPFLLIRINGRSITSRQTI